jgi:hypothetical protein
MDEPSARERQADWYWPLAALEYEHEIDEAFPDEARLLGTIMILWNRQELALRGIFLDLLNARQRPYAEAIWDRQPTHQAKRDMLGLALTTVRLSKRKAGILTWVIDHTKTLADRRNELIHAEYVVHHRTQRLHAKVKAPRSNKPPKYQQVGVSDLRVVVEELSFLLRATEGAYTELSSRFRRMAKQLDLGPRAKTHQPPPENQQSG